MKVVVELLSESWNSIKETTFRKSWRIIPMEPPTLCGGSCDHEEVDDDDHDDDYLTVCMKCCDVNQEQLHTWLNSDCNDPGYEIMTDEDICEIVLLHLVVKKRLKMTRRRK